MAARSTSAVRYAEAVFQTAREGGNYEEWLQQLNDTTALLSDQLAEQVLLSPIVAAELKASVLKQALPGLSASAARLLDLLIRRGRLGLLPQIRDSFQRQLDEERGLEIATITTAVPLGQAERDLIAARLSARTGKRVRLQETIDPAVIGGVVAQIGDEIIDGSVRSRLDLMRRALAGS